MSEKIDLDMLGVVEGTDKSSSVSHAWDYLRHYERLLSDFRDAPINVIEIGVAGGVSLNVWTSFFARAKIVGIDILPECARFAGGRVSIEIGSQDDPGFLARVCEKYPPSVVIDDGSHQADHVVYAFERMFPSLLPGGVYIVEDLALHFGETAGNWQGVAGISAPDYFWRIARSCMARSVQGAADWGSARYHLQQIDTIEFVAGAVAVRKQPAGRDVAAALDFAENHLRGRAPNAAVHERIAHYVLKHGGPLDRAEAELRRAAEIGGDTSGLLRGFSELYLRQDRLAEAASLAERAASLGGDPQHWHFCGTLHARLGDHAAAARALARAAAMHPGNVSFAVDLCNAHERNGDLAHALVAARQALKAVAAGSLAGTAHEAWLRGRVEELRAKVGD